MALSPQQSSGLARSVENGRVFTRFQFSKTLDPLIEGLNYASTQGAIQSLSQIRKIGQKVLEEVKRGFPDKHATEPTRLGTQVVKPLGLKDGWRVRFYDTVSASLSSGGPSLLGFYIDHKMANNDRIRTILASLESGSRPYTIYPKQAKALFFPGRKLGTMQFAASADIPERPAYGFLRKAQIFADQMLTSEGSQMEAELIALIEKGKRFKQTALKTASFDSNPPSSLSEAKDDHPTHFTPPNRALRAGRVLKRRMESRMFLKSYR